MRTFTTLALLLGSVAAMGQYRPDILGGDFLQRTFEMGDDFDGRVTSTLVRLPAEQGTTRSLLYIHGFNDYFFQKEMAERFRDSLYNFYAIDLRRYGRSILPHQRPFNLRSVDDYFADIDMAIATMRSEGTQEVILMGHSTGGLIAAIYAAEHQVDGLILNSPFLDMNFGWAMEKILIPTVALYGVLAPECEVVSSTSTAYAESLLEEYSGEWSYNTQWKYLNSLPITAGWLHAIHSAHRRVQSLSLPLPILLLSSDNSVYGDEFHEGYMCGDGVLDVADIQYYGRRLGANVTAVEIEGALHDVVLSQKAVRDEAYRVIFEWLNALRP